jgi:hypothetical protein
MDRTLIPRFLPENYRSAAARPGSPMTGLLAAMEALHGPAERILDSLPIYVSPWGAPDEFVLLQASWLGLDRYFDWSGDRPGAGVPRFRAGPGRLRHFVAEAAALNRERGTPATLLRILELATGLAGFAIEEGSRPFHLIVRAPAGAVALSDLIERIVEGERPTHTTFEILFANPEPEPKE